MSTDETTQAGEAAAGHSSGAAVLKDIQRMGRKAFGTSQIFGEAVRQGDTVVLPVGRMRGGAGGGGGSGPVPADGNEGAGDGQALGEGAGQGWGMDARALGAYVISDGKVSYVPAVDVNRIVAVGVLGLVAAIVLAPRVVRAAKR